MKTFPLVFALLCGALHGASAAPSFYVTPTGKDTNPGTQALPWKTMQKAGNSATPGSTVRVAAGTYNEKITINVQGTASGGTITFKGDPGAILSGVGKTGQNLITITDKSYLKITGFELTDDAKVTDGSAIRLEGGGAHIELRTNKIHNITGTNAMGITVYGTNGSTPFSDLIIEGNEIYDCQPAPSEALTLNGNVTGFLVTGNYVHDVNNIGIDMIGGEGICPTAANDAARSGICRSNRVERARSNYGGGYAGAIYIDGGRDILIERNATTQSDLGMEIGCENKGKTTTGITVRDNLLYNNDKAGLVMGGYDATAGRVKSCTFTNNTCFHNDTLNDGNGELWIQYASGNVIKNNIFAASPGSKLTSIVSAGVTNTLDYNLWFAPAASIDFSWKDVDYTSFAAFKAATKQDAHSLFADPIFANAARFDMRLKATSPGINAGDPAFVAGDGELAAGSTVRVQGGRVDIGAYESNVTTTPKAIVSPSAEIL